MKGFVTIEVKRGGMMDAIDCTVVIVACRSIVVGKDVGIEILEAIVDNGDNHAAGELSTTHV